MPHANAEALQRHLDLISETVARGAHAILILDGAGYHAAGALKVPDNITPLTLPPYSPELNSAENIWAWLRANKLANRVFETWDEIVDACCDAWNAFASDPALVTSITSREWAKVIV